MKTILDYLKDVIEGAPNLPPWSRWFEEHRKDIEKLISRGSFLRLRQTPLCEIPRILKQYQIEYHPIENPCLPFGDEDFSWIKDEWIGEPVDPYNSPNYKKLKQGEYLFVDLLRLAQIKHDSDEIRHYVIPDGSSGICLIRNSQPVFAVPLILVNTPSNARRKKK